jgi:hypothetical protein
VQCCAGLNIKPVFPTDPDTSGDCGAYTGAQVLNIKGNNDVTYKVVKVSRTHLVDPSYASFAPTDKDNTMEVRTACAFDRMYRAAAAQGVYIKIASAFRTLGRQQYFWNCYQCGCCNGGNLAAFPGA